MTVSSVENQQVLNNYINSQKSATTTTTTSSSSSPWGNFDTYLKLLSAQLSNQDPTQPMDASKFTEQLVQYAGIEQQIGTNDKLDSILKTINSNGITPLLSYVGQYIEAPAKGSLVVQNGTSKLAYTLPSEATSVKIYVKDSAGKNVATMDGLTTKGLNRVVWDGSLDSGKKATDGTYSFSLVAKNSKGETMEVTDIRNIGQVTGIETGSDGTTMLKVGSLEVSDSTVLSVFGGITTNNSGSGSNTTDNSSTDDTNTTT